MKKYLLAAALVMASASAMADRVVTGQSYWTEGWTNSASACAQAKRDASGKANSNEAVEDFSKCDCSQTNDGRYICTVDARFEKALASARADRVVTGQSYWTEGWTNSASACAQAKRDASGKANSNEAVEGFSKCDCSQTNDGKYVCTVDARLGKK